MGLFDRFKQKGSLSGTIELRGLPANCGYSVSVCLFPVKDESAPLPFDGDPPPNAYTDEISVKEKDEPERVPLQFTAQRRAGFYYVDVGLIVYFERYGDMFAQVEHFIPMRRPCQVHSAHKAEVSLLVEWPDIPFEDLHRYGTFHPQH